MSGDRFNRMTTAQYKAYVEHRRKWPLVQAAIVSAALAGGIAHVAVQYPALLRPAAIAAAVVAVADWLWAWWAR